MKHVILDVPAAGADGARSIREPGTAATAGDSGAAHHQRFADDQEFLLERPFYFYVTLWGRRFCDYLLEYCIPSLLAPGNIPALRTRRRSKMLIATRPEDWAAMKATPIFRLLERYVDAVFLEIPPCPPDKSGCEHMGVGHKAALDLAHRDQAYGILTVPDVLFSDGSIAALQQHARDGIELVMVGAALRLGEEPFLARLVEMGAIPRESRRDTGTPLSITGRQLSAAAVRGMHSEAERLEWEKPYSLPVPPGLWWRVPDEEGILIHALSWAPMLVDYGALARHDTSCLEQWTIDGDYAYKNFGIASRMHVVQDSDEIFYAGFGPLADRPHMLVADPALQLPLIGRLDKGRSLKAHFYGDIFDPLKREVFFLPIRWHSRPLNAHWKRIERRALWSMLFHLMPEPLPQTLHLPPGRRGRIAAASIKLALSLQGVAAQAVLRLGKVLAWFLLGPQFLALFARALWKRRRRVATVLSQIYRRYRGALYRRVRGPKAFSPPAKTLDGN